MSWIELGLWKRPAFVGWVFELGDHLPHGRGEFIRVTHPYDVHEHNFRLVREEVVMERRDVQSMIKCDAHDGVHLRFCEDQIPHHHRVIPHRRKCGPGGEAHRRRHFYPRHGNLQIAARIGHLKDALFFIEFPLESRQLFNFCGVQPSCGPAPRGHACDRQGHSHSAHTRPPIPSPFVEC